MDGLTINIGWEYFLGIMGSLILIAWYSGGRFTGIDTKLGYLEKDLKDFKTDMLAPAHSPRQLNERGLKILNESGIKELIDSKKDELVKKIREGTINNPYDAENTILSIVGRFQEFFPDTTPLLKDGAFKVGADITSVLLVGGFYLRNLIFKDLGFSLEELDKQVSLT